MYLMILLYFSKSKIPIDPFWAAAMLATFRALSSIIGSSVNGKCKRRPLYLICCGVSIFGQLSLSSFCYFDQDELLTTNFPFTRWIPIFSIMIIYTAFSFGFGGIPWMLQVIFLSIFLIWFKDRKKIVNCQWSSSTNNSSFPFCPWY